MKVNDEPTDLHSIFGVDCICHSTSAVARLSFYQVH